MHRENGERIATRSLDVSYYTLKVHWRDPLSMTYGVEAVIPLETDFPTLRTSSFTPSNNDGLLEKSLDLIEERRENAMVQLAYYQHKLK